MKKINISDVNKFLIDSDEIVDINNNNYIVTPEGNQNINSSPQNNINKSKMNTKYIKVNKRRIRLFRFRKTYKECCKNIREFSK